MKLTLKNIIDGYLEGVSELDFSYHEMKDDLSRFGISFSKVHSDHKKGGVFYKSAFLWSGSMDDAAKNGAIALNWVGDGDGDEEKPDVSEFTPAISYKLTRTFAGETVEEETFASDRRPIIISGEMLETLKDDQAHFSALWALGVESWDCYVAPPLPSEYETEEGWQKAYHGFMSDLL